jgi:hypothetical protein
MPSKQLLPSKQRIICAAIMKSTLIGFGGCVIIAIFLAKIISFEKMLNIMPGVIAFNGALIGYRLIESARSDLRRKMLMSVITGMMGGVFVWSALNIPVFYLTGSFILSFADLILYGFVSGGASVLGAKLAVRYLNI